jgi:hypothetical protein
LRPELQVPQLTKPPQPLPVGPQTWNSQASAAVSALHPQTPGVPPPPHVLEPVQPQVTVPPQPFESAPQLLPLHGSMGAQPHLPGEPPPPQVLEPVQPQLTALPHESFSVPQFTPLHGLPLGVHPHTFAEPPPPQVFEPVHAALPQSTFVPQLFFVIPHCTLLQVTDFGSATH